MSEDCRGCSGRCCYDIVVHVTPLDIRRLARAQALDPMQIVEPRAVTASDGPNSEAFGARIDASDRLYRTVLRRDPKGGDACQFLMQIDDANGRCGVYADRPRVCAVYPFTIRKGSIDLREDARCAPGDWRMARLDYAAFRRGIAVYAAEWHACARIVDVWTTPLRNGVARRRSTASLRSPIARRRRCS